MTDEQLGKLLLLSWRYDSAASWEETCEREHKHNQSPESRAAWIMASARAIQARDTVCRFIRELHRDIRATQACVAEATDRGDRRP